MLSRNLASQRREWPWRASQQGRRQQPSRKRPLVETLEGRVVLNASNLVVSSAVAPTKLTSSTTTQISWQVANRGSEATTANWFDSVYLSKDATLDSADTLLSGGSVAAPSSLAAGESYSQTLSFTVPTTASGDYYLLFDTDSSDTQSESNENDNIRAVPVALVGTSTALPDLVITDATAPAKATMGSIDVSWTVKNQGTSNIPYYWYDNFYLSKDATYSFDDTYIGQSNHWSGLDAGASQTYKSTVNATTATAGDYYLIIVADVYNDVKESNESNNNRALPITLTIPDVDLVVTSGTAPSTTTNGQPISLTWTVTNQGTQTANAASWYDYVYLSTDDKLDYTDQSLTSQYIGNSGGLAPGASYTKNSSVTVTVRTPGQYYLLFDTDHSHNQVESDDTNNIRSLPITISAANVDLIVTNVTAPASVNLGVVNVAYTVQNQGSDTAGGYWYDQIFLSTDNKLDSTDNSLNYIISPVGPSLAAGGTYTNNVSVNLANVSPGNYYLLVVANSFGTLTETDGTNNSRAVPITLTTSKVDLAFTAATAPSTAQSGGNVSLSWTVTNQGTDPASASYWYDYVYLSTDTKLGYDDSQLIGVYVDNTNALAPGGSYTQTAKVYLPTSYTGNYYLLISIDSSNLQSETDESNNLRAIPITITAASGGGGGGPTADLAVKDASAPSTATAGQYISVSWVVANDGTKATSKNWFDAVYLSTDETLDSSSDSLLASISIASQNPLSIGGAYIVSADIFIPANLATGDYFLIIDTNATESQTELTRSNNVEALWLEVDGASQTPVTVSSFLVNDGEAQRSMVTHLTLTFSQIVTFDADAFVLERSDGTKVSVKASSKVVSNQTVVVLSFEGSGIVGGSLWDGKYTLTILGAKIQDSTGNALDGNADGSPGGDYVDHLFRLFGDADGDGDVDNKDYFVFRSAAGKKAGSSGYLWFLDSDGDGTVSATTDYTRFKASYLKTIV